MRTIRVLSRLCCFGRSWGALASLALVLAGAGVLCGADTPGGRDGGMASAASGGGGDDETVGTLPSVAGGSVLDYRRVLRSPRPALYLEGPAEAVFSMPLAARGDVRARVEALSAGRVRLVLPGDVRVGLDRATFEHGGVRVGFALPEGAKVLRFATLWNGEVRTYRSLADLPVAPLALSGMLDAAPLLSGVRTDAGGARVLVVATPDVIWLTQTH